MSKENFLAFRSETIERAGELRNLVSAVAERRDALSKTQRQTVSDIHEKLFADSLFILKHPEKADRPFLENFSLFIENSIRTLETFFANPPSGKSGLH